MTNAIKARAAISLFWRSQRNRLHCGHPQQCSQHLLTGTSLQELQGKSMAWLRRDGTRRLSSPITKQGALRIGTHSVRKVLKTRCLRTFLSRSLNFLILKGIHCHWTALVHINVVRYIYKMVSLVVLNLVIATSLWGENQWFSCFTAAGYEMKDGKLFVHGLQRRQKDLRIFEPCDT